MKQIRYLLSIRKVVLLSVLFLYTVGCKKKENPIGAELEDQQLSVNTIDTLTIRTYTKREDSIASRNISISSLGSYNDPVFGITSASIYSQIRLSSDNVNFAPNGTPADIVIDSVVFSLEYQDYYGSLEAQTFEVYEITDDLVDDTAVKYYTSTTFNHSGVNIVDPASATQVPDPNNKVFIGGDSLNPQLRLKLDNSFGQKIINESGSTNLANNTNFLTFIKGLYITTNNSFAPSQGSILSFNLLDEDSKITIYYRDTVNVDTNAFDLLINSNCIRVNHADHDYTGTTVDMQLSDSTLGSSETYIQGLAGVKTYLELPTIKNIDSTIVINKALLTIPVNYNGEIYTPNDKLLILREEEGGLAFLPDVSLTGGEIIYNEADKVYEFNITNYVNTLLNGTYENLPLRIQTLSSLVVPNRTILYGSGGTLQPSLKITYTKY